MVIRSARVRRHGSGGVVRAFVLAGLVAGLAACGGGDFDDPATSPLVVETSNLFMTIENRAGLPLTNVTIAIVPIGAQTEYTQFYNRIESAEKRTISYSEFNGSDGTPFSLRVSRPRSVKIIATDINGMAYEVELEWVQS